MQNIINKYLFGTEYYPEQWPEDVWYEDMELMQQAGINIVTLNVFSWALLEIEEGKYDFSKLDKIMENLEQNSIHINFATPTATVPAWAIEKYPDILPVDENGNKYSSGTRQNYCPNNDNYKKLASKIAETLAKRYGSKKSIVMWHINNEYACHIQSCYCDTCRKEFQNWLKDKYQTIDSLNKIWNNTFWGLIYTSWDQIPLPKKTVALHNPALILDYRRFMDDSFLNLYKMERNVMKQYVSNVPITTNFVGFSNALDFYKWGNEVDFLAWDSYPDPVPGKSGMYAPLLHDLMRCAGKGESFALMESAVSQVNWMDINMNKRPGKMTFESYEAAAHGADAVMFFQWRQFKSGPEKYHSSIIPHSGRSDTRVFREVERLGMELKKMTPVLNTKFQSEVGLIFDFDNWRALEYSFMPSKKMQYFENFEKFYRVLFNLNIPMDIISQNSDLSDYKVIIAPMLYMTQNNFSKDVTSFVNSGGTFIASYFTGIVDENDSVHDDGYPGPLKEVLGIEVMEYEPQPDEIENSVSFKSENKIYDANKWCDTIELQGAEIKAEYNEGYYEDKPAVTVNKYGDGRALYIGTSPDDSFLEKLFEKEFENANVKPIMELPEGIKAVKRSKITGKEYIFILNYNDKTTKINFGYNKYREIISGEILTRDVKIESNGVMILSSLS